MSGTGSPFIRNPQYYTWPSGFGDVVNEPIDGLVVGVGGVTDRGGISEAVVERAGMNSAFELIARMS